MLHPFLDVLGEDVDEPLPAGDAVLRAIGIKVISHAVRIPRANACERLWGSVRTKGPDWLIILGERHPLRVLCEYFEHYNRARPHRALALRPPDRQAMPSQGPIVCRQRLHGLISEYSRVA